MTKANNYNIKNKKRRQLLKYFDKLRPYYTHLMAKNLALNTSLSYIEINTLKLKLCIHTDNSRSVIGSSPLPNSKR